MSQCDPSRTGIHAVVLWSENADPVRWAPREIKVTLVHTLLPYLDEEKRAAQRDRRAWLLHSFRFGLGLMVYQLDRISGCQ